MKSLYILLVAIAVSAASCMTKEGAPGPSGQNGLAQQGKVSGTLAYKDNAGNAISVPFSYSYYESLSDNTFFYDDAKAVYQLNCYRRDLKDYNNYMNLTNLAGGKIAGDFEAPTSGYFDFRLVKLMSNNDLFEFYGYFDATDPNSSYSITNFVFNTNTGRLIYDYELTFAPASIDWTTRYDDAEYATVTGHVDVTLNRTQSYNAPPQTALQ